MPDIPPELFYVDIVWKIEGGQEIAVNRVFHEHHHGAGNSFDWQTGLDKVAAKWLDAMKNDTGGGAHLAGFLHESVELDRIDAYGPVTADGSLNKSSAVAAAGDVKGSLTGQPMPPVFAMVVQLFGTADTIAHKRRHRGRIYMPATSATALDDQGLISAAFATSLASAWGAILNDVQGALMNDAATSLQQDYANVGVYSRTDGAFYRLESVAVARKPGWQRRRMNKLVVTNSSHVTINH